MTFFAPCPGVSHWLGAFANIHPASRDLFVFLIDEGKKEALLESCKALEVAAAQFSGLVNLVLYHQIGLLSATICLLIYWWFYLSPLYQAHWYPAWFCNYITATSSKCLKKDLTWFSQSFSRTPKSSKWSKGSASRMPWTGTKISKLHIKRYPQKNQMTLNTTEGSKT